MILTSQFSTIFIQLILFSIFVLFLGESSAFPSFTNENGRAKRSFVETNKVTSTEVEETIEACDETNSNNSFIYCSGKLLKAVQLHNIYNDSKNFVDKPLKIDAVEVEKQFELQFPMSVPNIDTDKLKQFIATYFDKEGTELESCDLDEWHEEPSDLKRIKDLTLRKWALELNLIWKKLCRKLIPGIQKNPDRYSLLYVPKPFIVPGGRFREFYYWDAYWIIKGLIASGLLETTKNMIQNFAYMVDTHGFIPNGGRVYYLKRSQPPFFIPMVYEYYENSNNLKFVEEILSTLEKEIAFWDTYRTFSLNMSGNSYTVYRYYAASNVPRPESYVEDHKIVSQLTKESEKKKIYRNLASAAESGWDFSSRWLTDPSRLETIQTVNIMPVDLNALMCWNFKLLSYLYGTTGNNEKAKFYDERHQSFKQTFEKVFYVKNESGWYDYDINKKAHNFEFFATVAIPLFTGCYDDLNLEQSEALFDKMEKQGVFNFAGGVPTSMNNVSTQQWDYPNGWSPLNHMIIEGLRQSRNARMQQKAFWLAQKWVLNNYRVYSSTPVKVMWEKYNVIKTNPEKGDGGEYQVQEGFGWSNGAVLDLLKTYSDRMEFVGLAESPARVINDKITKMSESYLEKNFNNNIMRDQANFKNNRLDETQSAGVTLKSSDSVLQRVMMFINLGILLTGLVVIG